MAESERVTVSLLSLKEDSVFQCAHALWPAPVSQAAAGRIRSCALHARSRESRHLFLSRPNCGRHGELLDFSEPSLLEYPHYGPAPPRFQLRAVILVASRDSAVKIWERLRHCEPRTWGRAPRRRPVYLASRN